MALTELLSTLSVGTYEQEFPTAFVRPTGPGSTNGDPQDGSLFKDSNGNGIPDRVVTGYTSNGQFTTFATKEASYNKFNLRSDSFNKNSFGNVTDQPFILRGLQRPNSAEPQFWGGFADTLTDIPRGGITTAVEREAVDKARIGKFMISPKGLIFQAKQFGLQLMNPNVEGEFGIWSGVTPRSNKIYNPLSVFSMNSPVPMHVRRDSFDPSGLTSYSYESVINIRNAAQNAIISNRLNLLRFEAFFTNRQIGLPYLTISNLTGPKSVLGVGVTTNNRYTNTSLRQSSLLLGAPGLEFITNPLGIATGAGINTGTTYDNNRYKNSNILADLRTYLQPTPLSPKYTPGQDDTQWSKNGRTKIRAIIDNPISFPQDSKVLENNQSEFDADKGKEYSTLAYGDITDAATDAPAYNDFRKSTSPANFTSFMSDPYNTGVGKGNTGEEYSDSNLVKRIGIGDYGAVGLNRESPRYVLDNNDVTVIKAHKDKADQLVLGNSTKDLVQFVIQIFEDDQYKTVTRFRSYIDSISTSFNQNVKSVFPANAVIPYDAYDRTVRQLSVDFKVPILSAVERKIIMSKLNTLAKLQYGIRSTTDFGTDAASGADFSDEDLKTDDSDDKVVTQTTTEKPQAAPLRIKIGNFTSIGCIINSLSYDIDNETPWDIDYETPMIVNVSLQATETATAYRADEISNFAYRQSGKIIG